MCNSTSQSQPLLSVEGSKALSQDEPTTSISSQHNHFDERCLQRKHRRQSDPIIGLVITVPDNFVDDEAIIEEEQTEQTESVTNNMRWREGYSASQACKPRRRSYTDVPISLSASGRHVRERQNSCKAEILRWRSVVDTMQEDEELILGDSESEDEEEQVRAAPVISLSYGSFKDRFGTGSSKDCDKIATPVKHRCIYPIECIVVHTQATQAA